MANKLPSIGSLLRSALRKPITTRLSDDLRRWSILLPLTCLLLLTTLVHRLALLLDRLLFPSFRMLEIQRPLFVMGPPRSGTTALHRFLAQDSTQFTTFTLWEILLAPAICQKLTIAWLIRWDRALGRPFARALAWCESKMTRSLESLHPTSLASPEEDYLLLLGYGACFLTVLPFPYCTGVWQLGRFDREINPHVRRRITRKYRELVQRHLYFHGPSRIFLSKNPTFCGWIQSLVTEFPDACFLGLWRTAEETVPSQLSSIQDALSIFGWNATDPHIVAEFVSLFAFFYAHLDREFKHLPERQAVRVDYTAFKHQAGRTVKDALRVLGYTLSSLPDQDLQSHDEQVRRYRSGHRYSIEQFGLTPAQLRSAMRKALASFDPAHDDPDSLFFGRTLEHVDIDSFALTTSGSTISGSTTSSANAGQGEPAPGCHSFGRPS